MKDEAQQDIQRLSALVRAQQITIDKLEAQRQWVGLTESEVSEIINEEIGFNSCWGPEESFAKAIETKLKEKNT